MDEGEENGAQINAYEKRNLKGYKGTTLPTYGIKVFILNSYFDSLDDCEFTDREEYKVNEFIVKINKEGFGNLEGRNKQSNNPDSDKLTFAQDAQFAIQYKLYHYHVGVEYYEGQHGDKTSEFVVHYSYCDVQKAASIIAVAPHPPFELPSVKQIDSGINIVND